MANQPVLHIRFYDNTNSPFVVDDVVRVYFDPDDNTFDVTKNGAELVGGPNLGLMGELNYITGTLDFHYWISNMDANGNPANILTPAFSYCESGTLNEFPFNTIFPYCQHLLTQNSPSCVGVVCNIHFSGTPVITRPSDQVTNDGSITIIALSVLGTVKYSLEDLPYSTMSNTSGVFTGLYSGTYTVYAKDSNSCTVTQTVSLIPLFNYGVEYRLEYDNLKGHNTRVDILHQDYTGLIKEVKGSGDPFILRLRGENGNFFDTVISTEASTGFISESDLEFINLFTQSDREYQLRYYKDTGSGYVEYWRGWLKPGLYEEPFTRPRNYAVTIQATDATAELKDIDFADGSGNLITGRVKLIKIVAFILSKLELDLPIRVACNLFEENHSSINPQDDPFDQTYIEPDKTYYSGDGDLIKCLEVLQNIVGVFGAKVYQWGGYWNIVRIDQNTDVYSYRVFSKDGDYVSSSSFDPIVYIQSPSSTERACWRDSTQTLEVVSGVGKIDITLELKKIPFGVENGGFEKINLPTVLPGNMNGYPGWTLVYNGNVSGWGYMTSVTSDLFKGNNSKYALFFGSTVIGNTSIPYGEDVYALSQNQPIEFTPNDVLHFKFDYYTRYSYDTDIKAPNVKFKFQYELDGRFYLLADGTWFSTDYVTSIAALKAIISSIARIGTKQLTFVFDGVNYNAGLYVLTEGFGPESSPDIILPDDFDPTYNARIWVLLDTAVNSVNELPSAFINRYKWVEVFTNTIGNWKTIEITGPFPNISLETTFNVKLMHGSFATSPWLLIGESALRAHTTINLPSGYRITTRQIGGGGGAGGAYLYRSYELFASVQSDNSPNYIRPNDYASSTNEKVWFLKDEVQSDYYYGMSNAIVGIFDNVTSEFMPGGAEAPDHKTYTIVNNTKIKYNTSISFINGDGPPDITNSKNIYMNYFRLSDGSPTKFWARTGFAESQPILSILAKQYVEQFQKPKLKLTGSFDSDVFFGFNASFYDGSRNFIPIGMTIHDKGNKYNIELLELKDVDGNTLNPFGPGEFDTNEFGQDYDI